jgi:threonine aldolase
MTDRVVELRSDTFTRPTQAMRRAMYEAEVGDDVWSEDPTVQTLERRAAELTGEEAAVFVTSGTQGNLTGVLAHTQRGDEIILGDKSHIFMNEVGGTAVVGGLQVRTVPNRDDGRVRPEDVRSAIRGKNVHFPPTALVAIENTHNSCGGRAMNLQETEDVSAVAHSAGVPLHIDGARIFNASVALGVAAARLAAPAESITFCLSKGLGAPAGSLLCGSAAYIERARKWRKLLGGGMRQSGILAAAGLVALERHIDRLAEDHANARLLAEGLAEISGITIDPEGVQTNIVFFDMSGLGIPPQAFSESLAERGVRIYGGPIFRAVTSYEVTRPDIEYALTVIQDVARARSLAPV